MLASIFHETGKVVGLHTSPHMLDLRERFRVGGRLVPECWVADFVDAHRSDIIELELSFFEEPSEWPLPPFATRGST